MDAKFLSKITTKDCGFSKTSIQKLLSDLDDGDEVDLYKVAGIVSDARPGQSSMGEFVKFIGEFVATRTDGKGSFSSGVAIFPKVAENLLFGHVRQSTEQNQSLEFSALVRAKKDETSAVGYTFTIQPLTELRASDRLANLLQRSQMQVANGSAAPALEAPQESEPDPAPARASAAKKTAPAARRR